MKNIQISRPFIKFIREKFNNNITISQYIIERLVYGNIHTGYAHKNQIIGADVKDNHIFKVATEHEKFDLIFSSNEAMTGINALTYAETFKRPGIIFTVTDTGFKKISVPMYCAFIDGRPLLLISLYEASWSNRITPIHRFIKDVCVTSESLQVPLLLEYALVLSNYTKPGPVHLNILNDVLLDNVNLDAIYKAICPIQDKQIWPVTNAINSYYVIGV